MEGSKTKPGFGFSWADEVEQEEEAQAQRHQQQRPNPFGSARPREVVLEEKGVDWRELDQKLHEPSNSNLSNVPRKEKMLKENIPASTTPVNRKQPFPSRSRGLGQKTEKTRKGCDGSGAPLGYLTPQNQNLRAFVPPLRYPPKNAMGLMEGMQHLSRNRFNVSPPSYQHEGQREFHMELQRENQIREHEMLWDYSSRRFGVSCRSPPPLYERHLELHELQMGHEREHMIYESGRRDFTTERLMGQSTGESHYMRTMRRSANGERELQSMDSNYNRGNSLGQVLVGPPVVLGMRGPPLNHVRRGRLADEDHDWGKLEDEYGTRNGCPPPLNHVRRGRLADEDRDWVKLEDEYGTRNGCPPPIEALPGRGEKFSLMNMEKTGLGRNCKNRRLRRKRVGEKMENENGRTRTAGEFVGSSMGAGGDTGRGAALKNLKVKREKSGSNNSRYHQSH